MRRWYRSDLRARFLSKVGSAVGPKDCWPWLGNTSRKGYGRIKVGRQPREAHRISWELHRGPIPDGMHVLHSCDNPPCVNPNHLFLGTNLDNVLDRMAKMRGGAKLTRDAVAEMRAARARGVQQQVIARAHGVSQTMVSYVVRRLKWAHVAQE